MTISVFGRLKNGLSNSNTAINLRDLTHSQYTTDEDGNYKHPFMNSPSEVQSIYYEKSGSFSTKLHTTQQKSLEISGASLRALGKKGIS